MRQILLGLQVRFTLLVVGLALTVGLAVGMFTVDFSTGLVDRLHRDHCKQTAALLAARAATEFTSGQTALHTLAAQMVRSEPLIFVSFMDPDGRLLAIEHCKQPLISPRDTFGFTPKSMLGTPILITTQTANSGYLDVTYPIRKSVAGEPDQSGDVGADLLGYVRIGYSLSRTFNEVSSTLELLSGISVIVASLTVPLGFFLVRRIVRPLRELARTMARFADGDQSARYPTERCDEIGELAGAYNLMADRLAAQREEILNLNVELEERVQQRTSQLRELAARDPLTGLYNRRHFGEVLQRRFAEAKRYGTELSCMMLDLDDFKSVNDRYGHQEGDQLLILTGITVMSQLRSADVAARYGGDEFIVLLPQTDTVHAQALGERIMSKLNLAYAEEFPDSGVTASVGIGCMVDVGTENPDDLIRAADRALYDAKSGGKATIAARQVTA